MRMRALTSAMVEMSPASRREAFTMQAKRLPQVRRVNEDPPMEKAPLGAFSLAGL